MALRKNIEIRLYAGEKDVLDCAGYLTADDKILFEGRDKFHWGYIPQVFFQMEEASEIMGKSEDYLNQMYPDQKHKIRIEVSDL